MAHNTLQIGARLLGGAGARAPTFGIKVNVLTPIEADVDAVWSRLQMPKQWDNGDEKVDFSHALARPATASASRHPVLTLSLGVSFSLDLSVVYGQHAGRTKFDKSVKRDTFGNVDGPEYASSCVSHVAWSPLLSLCDAQQVPALSWALSLRLCR